MRKLLVLLALVVSACGGGGGSETASPSPQAQASASAALPVYVFLGQSNMVGNGNPALISADLNREQSALIYGEGWWAHVTPGASFGPELSFSARAGAVGILKVAVSGTSLANEWSGPLLQEAIRRARGAAASMPIRFVGVFWMQGESDAENVVSALAYRDNLRAMVETIRREFAEADLPFVACRINPPATADFPGREVVRAAQMNPGVSNWKWLDCDGLSKTADGLHYDTAGTVQLGQMFAGAVGK